ncbi:hypothetical protein SteCoe_27364 [Stentor coeruleus]|uniref:Cysteine protease n=1 Tax=Stentor coeruleus TaxID=5963 RepID=A0A1R2BAQ2_9CILI|nr:hypothetical protein SteCoe_27364 [Stentor coeruleus]
MESNWLKKFTNYVRYNIKSSRIEELFEYGTDNPIVLLGEIYETKIPGEKNNRPPVNYLGSDYIDIYSATGKTIHNLSAYNEFAEKFKSILWVTYRSNFLPILRTKKKQKYYSSDAGWGCTLRAGQMLLLNTLKKHYKKNKETSIELFHLVEESLSAPYSIHNLINLGATNKQAGDWFCSAEVCSAIVKLSEINPIPGFRCCLFTDFTIYKDQVFMLAMDETENPDRENNTESQEWKNGVLIFFPLMLGHKKLEGKFYDVLKLFLSLGPSVGIVGGRPRSALYIVGYNGDNVICLDPHIVKQLNNKLQFKLPVEDFFCSDLILTKFKELESSMTFGFYFRTAQEFYMFEKNVMANDGLLNGLMLFKDCFVDVPETQELVLENDFILM